MVLSLTERRIFFVKFSPNQLGILFYFRGPTLIQIGYILTENHEENQVSFS